LGVGGWGLWVWGMGPTPQAPIPNPQSPIPIMENINNELKLIKKFNL
jgi:hypothetical protein